MITQLQPRLLHGRKDEKRLELSASWHALRSREMRLLLPFQLAIFEAMQTCLDSKEGPLRHQQFKVLAACLAQKRVARSGLVCLGLHELCSGLKATCQVILHSPAGQKASASPTSGMGSTSCTAECGQRLVTAGTRRKARRYASTGAFQS